MITDDIDDWLTVIRKRQGARCHCRIDCPPVPSSRPCLPSPDTPPVPGYAAWSKKDPPAARKKVVEFLIALYAEAQSTSNMRRPSIAWFLYSVSFKGAVAGFQ